MRNPISRVFGSSFDPKPVKEPPIEGVGAQMLYFDPFEPLPEFDGVPRPNDNHDYPILKPRDARTAPPFDPKWRAIVDTLWKRAEPTAQATRGSVLMGAARGDTPGGLDHIRKQTYSPVVNPLSDGKAYPDDWKHMDQIERTDAITMRGDSRSPVVVLGQDQGFFPPISRNDDYYVNNTIREYFTAYMKRRYGRDITQAQYTAALSSAAPSIDDRRLLADMMAWRKIVEGEAFHLGRMTVDEALKGYISTSKSFHWAFYFATRRCANMDGWMYITRVRGGFIVPMKGSKWGTGEQEIAQWGPIKAEDILGFRKLNLMQGGVGPIWIRPTFRKTDPHAYKRIFKMLCHWTPTAQDF